MKRILIISICILMCSITIFASTDYSDTENGIKFVVPEDWNQIERSELEAYYYVGFIRDKIDGYRIITYNRIDVWSTLSEKEKNRIPRSEFDNSVTSKKEISEIINVPEDDIHLVNYGGKEYFSGSRMSAILYDGVAVGTPNMLYLIHIENGWLYQFQYSAGRFDEYYDEFKQLMESVEYPYYEKTPPIKNMTAVYSLIGLVLLIGSATILAFIKIRIHKKEASLSDIIENICPYCRHKLSKDSVFCHKCGTKIHKEE